MRPVKEIVEHPRVTVISTGHDGGSFTIKTPLNAQLRVIAGIGMGWDHVSVSLANRTPRYQEMKLVKRIFFKPEEWAVEYHPPALDYISVNDNVLHLWRPHDVEIPTPPKVLV